jgi:protein arginine N-methyltransferase 5
MHSFAGYFECVLYKDVTLSTRPETKTPNLSNDTLYFPLKRPVQIQAGSTICARFWRLVEAEKQTWYEWTVEANDQLESLPIHNMGGRSFSMVHHKK